MLHLDNLSPKIINWNPPEDAHYLDQQHSEHQPVTIHNTAEPITDAATTPDSPNRDSSSPLSPVPDTAPPSNLLQPTLQHLNPHMALAEEKEAPLEIPQREEEEEEETAVSDSHQNQETEPPASGPKPDADNPSSSRQSTPLSELSPPPPDQDDEAQDPASTITTNGGDLNMAESRPLTVTANNAEKSNGHSISTDASGTPQPTDPSPSSALSGANATNHTHTPQDTPTTPSNPLISPTQQFSTNSSAHAQPHDSFTPGTPLSASMNLTTPPATSTNTQDPRAVTVLELNVELLKICMFLQNKGVQSGDPRFQIFAARIQSNLAYLATAADSRPSSLPILDPFPATDPSFSSVPALATMVERIRQTYKELPSIFAKDLARRQSVNMGMNTSSLAGANASTTNNTHPTSPPNNLKRERQDEIGSVMENGAKRRDTGEGKSLSGTVSPTGSVASTQGHQQQAGQGQMLPPASIPITTGSTSPPGSVNGPVSFSVPISAGGSNQNQHQQQGQGQQRQRSVPPRSTSTPQTPSMNTAQLPGQQSSSSQQQPPTPTSASSQHPRSSTPSSATSNNASHTNAMPHNTSMNPPQQQQNPQTSNDMINLGLPTLGINPSEAQLAATNRERVRQQQIRMAQQQQQQQQQQMRAAMGAGSGGGPSGNMGMGMGVGAQGMGGQGMGQGMPGGMSSQGMSGASGMGGGMSGNMADMANMGMGGMNPSAVAGGGGMGMGGMSSSGGNMGGMGDMLPPSTPNPRMMQQHGGGMGMGGQNGMGGGMSPPNMNMGVNVNALAGPSGMGGMAGMQGQSSMGSQGGGGMAGGNPMSMGGGQGGQQGINPALMQQFYQVLRTPNHPMLKFMIQQVPGFEGMPMNMQLQKFLTARSVYMQRQEMQQQQMAAQQAQLNQMRGSSASLPNTMSTPQQQHAQLGGMGMGGNMAGGMSGSIGGGSLGNAMGGGNMGMGGGMMGQQGNVNAMSPVQPTSIPQNMMHMGGGMGGSMGSNMGGIDPRMMNASMAGGGAGAGGMGGLSAQQQQRQLLLLQQQRMQGAMQGGPSGGGGGGMSGNGMATGGQFNNMGGGGGNMSSMMLNQQQMMMRQQQQQQQQHAQAQAAQMAGGASSPTHVTSPLGSDGGAGGFPSGAVGQGARAGIPGIARSTRSPTDSASPMTPRGPQQRMPSMGHDDYQRMLLQQQQNQAMRAMASGSPAFNQQMSSQQQMAQMQQQQQQQQQSYGMSPPPSASGSQFGGGISAPSPTGNQNWGTPSQGGYPFAGSPVGGDQRHMSGTPAPQQQQQAQHTPQTMTPTDPMLSNDFNDLFNWSS